MSGSDDIDPSVRFFRIMAECESVAFEIASAYGDRSSSLSTQTESLLKFPGSIDHLSYEVKT